MQQIIFITSHSRALYALCRLALCALFISAVPVASGSFELRAQAQSTDGKIAGSVADAKTGEMLIGVTIAIEGTKKGAKTNVNGKYSVVVQPGSHKIRVSAVGYKTKVLDGVSVLPGDVRNVDIALESAAVQGQDVVVQGKIETESATSQLIQRRKASTFNDVLAAEQIRRTPDATSSDAVKRIPGVAINEGKYVVVRGTSERYNGAMLNGVSLTSTEPDKKAFSFDMLPANLIDNTVVSKTFTPDLPANFSGGLVQINTVSFPDRLTARLSIGSSYNGQTTGKEFISYQTGGSDWLGYDDGTRAMPGGMPSFSLNDTSINPTRRQTIGRSFNNTWGPQMKSAPLSTNFSASIGNAYETGEESEFGFIGTLSYRNSFDRVEIERNQYGADRTPFYERTGERNNHNVLWGGLLNLTYKLSPLHILSFKNVYNQNADDDVIQLEGVNSNSQFYERLTSYRYMERSVYSGQLTGEHVFPGLNNLRIDWRASQGISSRKEPDLRRFTYYRDTEDTTRFFSAISSTGSPTAAGRFYSNMEEKNNTGSLDLTLPVAGTKIKFGGYLESKTRNFDARVFSFRQSPANSNFMLIFSDIDTLLQQSHIGPDGFEVVEVTNPEDRYDASENIAAGYLMLDAPFTIASQNFRFIGGARVEKAVQRLNSSVLGGSEVHYDRPHTDLLPAASLIYSLTEASNLRLSATQTLSRPEFREIAPFNFYDFEIGTVVVGDTNIDRALVRNLDIRYELFPTAGELISISAFHKRFEGAIEEINIPTNGNPFKSWRNATVPAINYGVELEIRKNLGFISDYMLNFTFSSNYSYIFSKVDMSALTNGIKTGTRPMQGQSPFTVNAALLFIEPTYGTAVNLLYNTFGKRLASVYLDTEDLYEMPRDVFDISISQSIFERYELRYNVRDILAQPQEFKSGNQLERLNRRAASHSLSFSVKF